MEYKEKYSQDIYDDDENGDSGLMNMEGKIKENN